METRCPMSRMMNTSMPNTSRRGRCQHAERASLRTLDFLTCAVSEDVSVVTLLTLFFCTKCTCLLEDHQAV